MSTSVDYLVLTAGWVCWCTLHSVLITTALTTYLRARWPQASPYYRLTYNGFSLVSLLPLWWWTFAIRATEAPVFIWTLPSELIRYSLLCCAMVLFISGAWFYDMQRFLGIRQLTDGYQESLSDPDIVVSHGVSRYIRHPWYLAGILLIWVGGQTLYPSSILVATILTGYFFIGSRLEDKKLVSRYGVAYRNYMARVPGIIPLLLRRANNSSHQDE